MKLTERKIATLFKNLCCSRCKSDFDENSIEIIREENSQEDTMLVVKLICNNCGKSFGLAFLGLADIDIKSENFMEKDFEMHMYNEAPPITTDEVLDAHEFIKNLDCDWKKYLK